MKLYESGRAPNPRRVRIFLAEKRVNVPLEPVNLGALGPANPQARALLLHGAQDFRQRPGVYDQLRAPRPFPWDAVKLDDKGVGCVHGR